MNLPNRNINTITKISLQKKEQLEPNIFKPEQELFRGSN